MNINPNDPRLQRGLLLNKKQALPPPIPYGAFIGCGLHVYLDGKIQPAILAPQPIDSVDEAFQLLQLLITASRPKPAPLDWSTVPEDIQRYFRFSKEDGISPHRDAT